MGGDRNSSSEATTKRKKVVCDETALNDVVHKIRKVDKDEDLNDAVDKVFKVDKDEDLIGAADQICKGILDYSFPTLKEEFSFTLDPVPYYMNKSRLAPQGSFSSSSRFLAFSHKYRSKFDKFMEKYSRVGIYHKKDVLPDHGAINYPIAMVNDKDVLKRYKNFKRFDTVVDHSDHLFSSSPMVQFRAPQVWADSVLEERRILEEGLPETIFVRAYELRMDLLRAVVIGPKGTPYHDGLFFFDLHLPPMFPLEAPLVRYHSFGFGINPYLFECGQVRLKLVRVWALENETLWYSSSATLLKLLVSIRDRVLNADPLFHQPGFPDSGPSVAAEYLSLLYNEDVMIKSLKTMIHIMRKPPKNFEALVVGHFRNRALDILRACKAYMEGVQVGGGVGNKDSCCSIEFRNEVDLCFRNLRCCFMEIEAFEAYNFYLYNNPLSAPTSMSLTNQSINAPLRLQHSREEVVLVQETKETTPKFINKSDDCSDSFSKMRSRFLSFKKNKYLENLECYKELAQAQAPKLFLVISCADSRVCPSYILGFQPGEAFVFRNVANFVPPFKNGPCETNAALEFSVNDLQVENILVTGHSCCVGIRTLMTMHDEENSSSFIKNRVKVGKEAKSTTKATASNLSFDQQCKHCEKESINNSLLNLLTYPWVEERVAKGLLSLHGGYYDFVDCSYEKWTLDHQKKKNGQKQESGGACAIKNREFWS